jgi:hypothetical protein
VMFLFISPFSRMDGMAVACKNAINPSIFAYGWHGGRVQEWHKAVHFGLSVGKDVVMF